MLPYEVIKRAKCSDEEKKKLDRYLFLFIDLSMLARRMGILSIDNELHKIDDDSLKNFLAMVVDGVYPEFIEEIMMDNIVFNDFQGFELFKKIFFMKGVKLLQNGTNTNLLIESLINLFGEEYMYKLSYRIDNYRSKGYSVIQKDRILNDKEIDELLNSSETDESNSEYYKSLFKYDEIESQDVCENRTDRKSDILSADEIDELLKS